MDVPLCLRSEKSPSSIRFKVNRNIRATRHERNYLHKVRENVFELKLTTKFANFQQIKNHAVMESF